MDEYEKQERRRLLVDLTVTIMHVLGTQPVPPALNAPMCASTLVKRSTDAAIVALGYIDEAIEKGTP